jgi:predicted metal-binding membrane protein
MALEARPVSVDRSREGRDLAFALILAALVTASWLSLWLWSASPYARYVAHGGYLDPAAFAALCRAVPGGTIIVPALLHAAAWLLMIAAMMLPTSYPLLAIFRRIVGERPDEARLTWLVVTGFVLA